MTIPRPFRPDDEQPTMPFPFDASHPSLRHPAQRPAGYGQRARPTQRPKVTQGPVHVDELPTQRMALDEILEQARLQRLVHIDYHKREAGRLRDEAEWIECAAPKNLVSHSHVCCLHQEELDLMQSWDWSAMTDDERDRERFLGAELLRLRTEMAILRNSQMQLWQQARRHDDAIVQIEAEMAAVGR